MIRERLLTPTGAFRAWPGALLLLVCFGACVVFTIGYVRDQQRAICDLVVMLDDRNQALPPAPDPDTANFRAELHRYRVKIGC